MRKFLYSIKKFPNYLGRFGFYSGLKLFIIIERHLFQSTSEQVIVKLPQTDYPVYLRPTIADFSAFWICLVAEQYSTSPFPQSDRLSAVYEDMLGKGKRPLIIDAGAI
tara:strand:- start:3808 stop:4131 length:324 start_codon:yes stop_codon:yes gene_type:complete